MKNIIKSILKLSPIPLSKNHRYDLLTNSIIKSLNSNANTIDVGCHKGEILDKMLSQAPNGTHYGFEPIPELFEKLQTKYQNHDNCKIFEIAASNKSGQSNFNYVVSNPSYSGLIKRDYDKPNEIDESITVETKRLDEIIPQEKSIDLIKNDVEGGELLVLQGASSIIKNSKPIVIFEHGLGASDHYDSTPEKVFNFFQMHDMKIFLLENFLKNKEALSFKDFENQYYKKLNYYFVAGN